MQITGETAVYGIVGSPVEHSLSPIFQAHFVQQSGMNAVYVPYHVNGVDLATAMRGLLAIGVQGVNVTVPYKEAVLPYVHADDDVLRIGAANTLKVSDQGWRAYNTDWKGVSAVMQGTGLILQGATILLFGAGGTARAVLHAAHHQNIATVKICNRSSERAYALIEHARLAYPEMHCEWIAWDQLAVDQASAQSLLLLNTTSIGLDGHQTFPFVLSGEGWAMDAVYHPSGSTAFTRAAMTSRGERVVDGLPMLVAQGACSFEIWHPEVKLDMVEALLWMMKTLKRDPLLLPAWRSVG